MKTIELGDGKSSVLAEAERIIHGDRKTAYGNAADSFADIARIWSVILKRTVTPLEVSLCMIGLKLVRETNGHQFDNLVDIAGYSALAQEVHNNATDTNLRK